MGFKIKNKCPYCKKPTSVEFPANSAKCDHCGEGFAVGLTDYNGHSPSEINSALSNCAVMGELTQIAFRRDEILCEQCGTAYGADEPICPVFAKAIQAWYAFPDVTRTVSKVVSFRQTRHFLIRL